MTELDPHKYDLTPVMVAAADGDSATVERLIAAGAKINVRDNRGATALMYAVRNGHRHVIRVLLQAGADPRLSTNSDLTAFEIARKCGFTDILNLLQAAALALEALEASNGGKPTPPTRQQTHYDNLKVSRDAPPEVIRAAYRSLSQKYHPDRNPGNPDAARIMAILNVAYEVLADPVKRKEHDRWIEQENQPPQSSVREDAPSRTTRDRRPNPQFNENSAPESEFHFKKHLGRWWLAYAAGVVIISLGVETKKPEPPRAISTQDVTPTDRALAHTPAKSDEEIARAIKEASSKRIKEASSPRVKDPAAYIERDLPGKSAALPLPVNGKRFMYARAERVAPLSVVTRETSNHFFVKLEDWDTGTPIMGIFVRAGHSIEIKVPLGSFRLKYATGTQWFGDANEDLFGPETGTYQADKRFDFYQSGNQISGYTVELYLQPDGNLHTAQINRRNW